MNGELIETACEKLKGDEFNNRECSIIYIAMMELQELFCPIDPVLVISHLRHRLEEDEFPDSIVYEMASDSPSGSLFDHYIMDLVYTRSLDAERSKEKDFHG